MSSNQSSSRNSEDSMTKDDSHTGEFVANEDKSTFYSFIKQVASFSGDLSQLTCPGFLLCGASIIEYCAHYGDHPTLFKEIATATNSLERTTAVTKWFISTLYGSFRFRSKDNFEKKPYNPVLGERFECTIEDSNKDLMNVKCEQVSHHPPVSAFYIESPDHGVYANGHCGQKSKFKGTTIKVDQVGHVTVKLVNSNDTFIVTLPSMHIRSLITGRPFLDLYGESYVYSSSGHVTTIIYNQKPWFGGDYFFIEGHIKDASGSVLRTLSGKWTEEFKITDKATGVVQSFNPEITPMAKRIYKPIEEQDPIESRKLWREVTKAIEAQDFSLATQKKSQIEEAQRQKRKEREANNEKWVPLLYDYIEREPERDIIEKAIKGTIKQADVGSWIYKHHLKK